MIATVGRSCVPASFGRHPWVCTSGEPLVPLPPSQLWTRGLPHPQHMPQPVAAWDGEGPVIRSFTILGDAAVSGWHWELPLLCRCTENSLRSLRVVPSSQSWHQTGTNRKGQVSPSSRWRGECVSSSSVLPESLHISHIVSHHCCCIALRCRCVLVSPLLLSRGLFFQDCSIWLHCNI